MGAGDHTRLVNGILGLLCREHFPGMVLHANVYEPAWYFEHYYSAKDHEDSLGANFDNMAERVKGELWVSRPHRTLLNSSHSDQIRIACICRISSGAMMDMRKRRGIMLIEPAKS